MEGRAEMDLSHFDREQLEHEVRAHRLAKAARDEAASRGRRRGEPGHEDHTHERANGLDAGYKGIRVGAHGPLGVLALVFLLVGGTAVYVTYRGFEDVKGLLRQSTADHDLLSCVVSLSPEDRATLRYAATRHDFQRLCPWLRTP